MGGEDRVYVGYSYFVLPGFLFMMEPGDLLVALALLVRCARDYAVSYLDKLLRGKPEREEGINGNSADPEGRQSGPRPLFRIMNVARACLVPHWFANRPYGPTTEQSTIVVLVLG